MSETIDFYFDYSSPFGYLASERIEDIAQRYERTVIWHPILLGAVFKVTGAVPLTQAPLKGIYAMQDFSRSARQHQIDYHHPEPFPVATVAACRATLWLRENPDPSLRAQTTDFVHAVFRAFYSKGQDITNASVLGEIGVFLGIDSEKLIEGLGNQNVKDLLRKEVDLAIELGIFGSPMMIVDDEPFWGHDRLEQMEHWLNTGGW